MSGPQLETATTQYIREAQKLGVTHNVAFAKWSYMRITNSHEGQLLKMQKFMTDTSIPSHPNNRVKYLMQFQVNRLEAL